MEYEPIFKFPEYNIFMTDLFLQNYWQFNPIITMKNGGWEMFLSEDMLKKVSERGYSYALQDGFFEQFEEESMKMVKLVLEIKDTKVEEMDNEQLTHFIDKLFGLAKKFLAKYNLTEFINFTKIEKEIQDYIEEKDISFEEVMSGCADLTTWPEDKRKLADYIINMQHLKFELRKVINKVFIGPTAVIPRLLQQLVIKTGREDALNMTLKEIKNCLNGKEVKEVTDRYVYSYIIWDKDNEQMIIISGGDAYRKIRELDKDIPQNEVIGVSACKGLVKGIVKIIPLSMTPEKYFGKMEKDDILVSDTTGPEMIPLMEKAAAIVTDEGGMMSHAAIVSREFNIPCVVGTKYATKTFKDGDLIEVNANNGVVRKI